jgi:ABC-type antimicrobial peptide transport system permease subunit
VKPIVGASRTVDAKLALRFQTLSDRISGSLAQERVTAVTSSAFGALALVLAALGLYGVTAYAVARRRGEIGIRMALGASTVDVLTLVLSKVALLVGGGIAIGVLVSAWASRVIASLLYGLGPRDPATLALAALVMASVAALAAWLPARRAARIDPAVSLRDE